MKETVVSVIINNYNYGDFLEQAIDSALRQTYNNTEVVVVDDGSIDNSCNIIDKYGNSIISIKKSNGGQGSAFNVGFFASAGDVVLFLDADDILVPTAVETVLPYFSDHRVARVQWPLHVIDRYGREIGALTCANLSSGDLRQAVLKDGPYGYKWAPTSGNAWSRRYLEEVFPVPEIAFANAVDNYLSALSPLFGTIVVCEAQSYWRKHGRNDSQSQSNFDKRLAIWLSRFEACCEATERHCGRLGINFDATEWRRNSWFHRIDRSIKLIDALLPEAEPFVLVDQKNWAVDGSAVGRTCFTFPERNGEYWGCPPDDAAAISELEKALANGVRYFVWAWPAFWWLDHYKQLSEKVFSDFRCIESNDDIIIFHGNY